MFLYSSPLLILPVPPAIDSFSFQEELSEGMRCRVLCTVNQGDPPITITWLKDGSSLAHVLGANVSDIDLFSSLLSISSLTSSHSGEYTCVASNAATETRFSATMQVKGTVGVLKLVREDLSDYTKSYDLRLDIFSVKIY